jgi:predicted metal-dependent hydrolase
MFPLSSLLSRQTEQLSLLPNHQTLPTTGQRFVFLLDRVVPYQISRRARRSISIRVDNKYLKISAPPWVSIEKIESLIHEKTEWILQALHQQENPPFSSGYENFEQESFVYLFGEPYQIILHTGSSQICHQTHRIWIRHGKKSAQQAIYQFLQNYALTYFNQRVQLFSVQTKVGVNRIALTKAKGRWGSCSSEGTIRLHWRLIHLCPSLIDYVIAHEVAHLSHMDHSPAFWNKVASLLPDYKSQRLKLKDFALLLKLSS